MGQQTGSAPVMVTPIAQPKPGTWYYGVRCACRRLVCLCEDLFAGRGDEELLQLTTLIAVRCECGRARQVRRLQRFRTP